jgi:TPP-dependent pyruvate/acetoin dehydrogenase alpha subunit
LLLTQSDAVSASDAVLHASVIVKAGIDPATGVAVAMPYWSA